MQDHHFLTKELLKILVTTQGEVQFQDGPEHENHRDSLAGTNAKEPCFDTFHFGIVDLF